MSLIPVIQSDSGEETTRRIIHSINFSEDVLAFSAVGSVEAFTTTVPILGTNSFGGLSVDRSVFRRRLKDARWFVYAAGMVNTIDGNGAILSLQYVKDDATLVLLGSTTVTPGVNVNQKVALGPFNVFATPGVPAGETIPIILLTAQKVAGSGAALFNWTVWSRFLPRKE